MKRPDVMIFGSHAKAALLVILLVVAGGTHAMAGHIFRPWRFDRKWAEFDRLPRHEMARASGVPAAYAMMRNPLPVSSATIAKGKALYAKHCGSCHGSTGEGDGPAGRALRPPPGDLAWLAEMKLSRSDGFMYWAIAEGGEPIGSAMPSYKYALSIDQIWAVTSYIQIHLPRTPRADGVTAPPLVPKNQRRFADELPDSST